MDELDHFRTDRTNICFTTMEAEDEGKSYFKATPTPTHPTPAFQGGTFIVVLFC